MRKRTITTFVYAALSCMMLAFAGTSAEAYFAYSGYASGLSSSVLDARLSTPHARPAVVKDESIATIGADPTYVFRYAPSVSADNGAEDAHDGHRVQRSSAMHRLIAPNS